MLKDLAELREQMERALAMGNHWLALKLLRRYLQLWHQIWPERR